MNRKKVLIISAFILALWTGCGPNEKTKQADETKPLSTEEIRRITRDAYTYAFPIIDNLRVQYSYFVDRNDPEYKAPYNVLFNIPRVFTPKDRIIQTPNSDTPYSWAGLDLKTEPVIFIIPKIEASRYWSLQLIDLYTHNFDYLGSRTTGNDGGVFMVAGPNWKGETPKGVSKVIRCETEIAMALIRTQLFNPKDLDNVKKVQSGYKLLTLSSFLGKEQVQTAQLTEFPKPLSPEQQRTSLAMFDHLNFALTLCPTHSSETQLLEEFKKIGIDRGKKFDTTQLATETLSAMRMGIADAWRGHDSIIQLLNQGKLSSSDGFGTREFLNNNYLLRMASAAGGIYGNSKEEAMYPVYYVDNQGQALDGQNSYQLTFAPGQLPPVNAFWSLTMYDSSNLLVENPINRYLLNSTMLNQLKKDKNGAITLYIQHQSPGKNLESNWLPAPGGSFRMIMRLYWPKPEALNGQWKQPKVLRKI
ncbi:MAG TPA: DUF1254 domain-containing protein [Chitinophagaceae bacterium]|nr:DUF1254 domain-containing protein [Chitinophagaceae bacterium]